MALNWATQNLPCAGWHWIKLAEVGTILRATSSSFAERILLFQKVMGGSWWNIPSRICPEQQSMLPERQLCWDWSTVTRKEYFTWAHCANTLAEKVSQRFAITIFCRQPSEAATGLIATVEQSILAPDPNSFNEDVLKLVEAYIQLEAYAPLSKYWESHLCSFLMVWSCLAYQRWG